MNQGRKTRSKSQLEKLKEQEFFKNLWFHIVEHEQARNLCVMQSLCMYLEANIFPQKANFIKIYAWRRKTSLAKLETEIKNEGIRLNNLHKIVYDKNQDCFYSSQFYQKIFEEKIDEVFCSNGTVEQLFDQININSAILQYFDPPRLFSLMTGDKGPNSKGQLHTVVIKKIQDEWWLFDTSRTKPINLSKNNEFFLEWIHHTQYMNIIRLVPCPKESEKDHQKEISLYYKFLCLDNISKGRPKGAKKSKKQVKDKIKLKNERRDKKCLPESKFVSEGQQKKLLVQELLSNKISYANNAVIAKKTICLNQQNGKQLIKKEKKFDITSKQENSNQDVLMSE